MPDAIIPSLEAVGLSVVPGYRIDPETEQEDPTWRARYFAWYEKARDWRLSAQKRFVKDTAFRQQLLFLCSRDPAFFTLTFLEIEEPRAMAYYQKEDPITLEAALASLSDTSGDIGVADLSYRTIHPFIPFAYQVEAMQISTKVVLGPLRTFQHNVLWDKARGVGMSYAFLAWAYWGWLFVPGLRGTMLTEKWDKAERTKDINALFGKLDLFLDSTPDLLIPTGFKWRGEKDADRLSGRLINPANGSAIYTEPTTADSTRSGREAYVAVDELNFHQYLDETVATIQGTTFHFLGWTTASRRYGRQGERLLEEGRKNPQYCTVKTLDWFVNPHHDTDWYTRELARFIAIGKREQFEVEYLRNPTAGSGRLVYIDQLERLGDQAWTTEGYDPTKVLKISVDPGISDFTAFVFWQTHFLEERKRIRWLEAVQLRNVPVQFWAHVLTGILPKPARDGNPPDEMYRFFLEGFFDDPNIQRVMAFMRDIPPTSIKLYGDPSVRSRDSTHESWNSVFGAETKRIRQREYGAEDPRAIKLMVMLPWEVLYKRNNYQDQRVGMREALMMSEFSQRSPGVVEFYDALRNTMFQETTERSTRAPGHLHTDEYHQVSAGQYGMIWETLKLTPSDVKAEAGRRTAGTEKPKTTRRTRPVQSPGQRSRTAAKRDTLVGLF